MDKMKKVFKNLRVIVLLFALILAVIAISPSLESEDQLAIRNIIRNSAAEESGIEPPAPQLLPRQKELLLKLNNDEIKTLDDYNTFVESLEHNRTVLVTTNKGKVPYRLITKPIINESVVDYQIYYINKTNETTNESYLEEVKTPILDGTVLGTDDLGFVLYKAPKSNIRLGLDLEGGTRVMLQPEEKVSDDDLDVIIENLKERLNVYGLSDILVRSVTDLENNKYIIVEIPGANEEEVRELIGKQGKFEARIGESVAFQGGDDIKYVCRNAQCSGIDPDRGCGPISEGGYACTYRFAITLSQDAAQKQADITSNLDVVYEGNSDYLSKDIDLYLDDGLVDSLKIGAELKGKASTDIAISGSGKGATNEEAVTNALNNMKRLQTILITGSLPVKLNIVKTDAISPTLGSEFIKNAIFIGLLAIATVSLVILIRYRKLSVMIPMSLTMLAETIMILGFAAVLRWNMDISAIAGIIIVAGTGVDHLIVITDSVLKGEYSALSWKEKIKNAFSVIMIAYLTTTAAMIFLFAAGGGLLKGFALTTILGVSIGVFIARPAYAAIIQILLKD